MGDGVKGGGAVGWWPVGLSTWALGHLDTWARGHVAAWHAAAQRSAVSWPRSQGRRAGHHAAASLGRLFSSKLRQHANFGAPSAAPPAAPSPVVTWQR
eukprot:356121-Chlamydomonas_euryale.AAC.6